MILPEYSVSSRLYRSDNAAYNPSRALLFKLYSGYIINIAKYLQGNFYLLNNDGGLVLLLLRGTAL